MLSQGSAPPREGLSQVQPCPALPCPWAAPHARNPWVLGTPGCQGARGSGVPSPAGALVLLSLAYLTSLFYYIPKAALAAVIISAVVPMFDAGIFRTLWRVKSEGMARERAVPLLPLCVRSLTLSVPSAVF